MDVQLDSPTQPANPDPFTRWFSAFDSLRRLLRHGRGFITWHLHDAACNHLSSATWPLAQMARSAGTSFLAMLQLRAELDNAQWRDTLSPSLCNNGDHLIPLMVSASVEVEALLLAGTRSGNDNEVLTGKKAKMFKALKEMRRPATIEEIVMHVGGRARKVNSDDRRALRELTGVLIHGLMVKVNKGGGKATYELIRVSDDSRR